MIFACYFVKNYKKQQKMKKSILLLQKLALVSGLIILGFTSCKKEEVMPELSSLYIKHVSPDLAAVDVYIDGQKINTALLTYNNKTNITNLPYGLHTIKAVAISNGAAIINSTVFLVKNKNYTFYISNKATTLEGLLIEDPKTRVIADSVQVRILNLSHDGPAYNVSLTNAATNLFTGVTYKTPTAFTRLYAPKSGAALNLQVKHTTTNAVVANVNATMFPGKTYTIIVRGFTTAPTGNTNTLGCTMLTNK